MKLVVLISVLISSLFAEVDVQVTVRGKLTCPTPFNYRITLWEEDNYYHDLFGKLKMAHSNGTATYEISGMAHENIWTIYEDEVEPWMTIEHTCGSVNACVCKKLGDYSEDVEMTVDVNLEKPGLEFCKMCNDAVAQRGNE